MELDKSVMMHEEEREVLGLEISTNKSNGLIMWHGQTSNNLTPDDYIAVAVVDGYVRHILQYNFHIKIKYEIRNNRTFLI